jgi:hypothetical protein
MLKIYFASTILVRSTPLWEKKKDPDPTDYRNRSVSGRSNTADNDPKSLLKSYGYLLRNTSAAMWHTKSTNKHNEKLSDFLYNLFLESTEVQDA